MFRLCDNCYSDILVSNGNPSTLFTMSRKVSQRHQKYLGLTRRCSNIVIHMPLAIGHVDICYYKRNNHCVLRPVRKFVSFRCVTLNFKNHCLGAEKRWGGHVRQGRVGSQRGRGTNETNELTDRTEHAMIVPFIYTDSHSTSSSSGTNNSFSSKNAANFLLILEPKISPEKNTQHFCRIYSSF